MPPRLSSTTCSPSDGFHHVRALPARSVSQLIQLVSRSPVFTRQSQFSRSTSVMDLITRRVIQEMEGTEEPANLVKYADPESGEYNAMVEYIGKKLNFTSLRYHRLDDMIQSVGIDKCKLCTYCWDGQE